MFKLLQRFTKKQLDLDVFHPQTPVVPETAVDIDELQVYRYEYFPQDGAISWLDRENAHELVEKFLKQGKLSPVDAQLCYQWIEDGYVIVKDLFSEKTLDSAWAGYEQAISDGTITPEPPCNINNLPGRNLNTHFQVKKIAALLHDRQITRIISLLLGAKCLPFQTITGHNGSQQLEHSDAIHMTTYPRDYLAATWTAMEDIHPDSGPLVYYPGSHRLPYFLSKEANISLRAFQQQKYAAYSEKYEPGIQKIIRDNNLEAKYFHAKKGDTLIWHSNLIHGGSKRKDMNLSRKALVCHYFAEGCICYHDLAASLAHIHH